MKYFYGMRLRGFSPGCQPMDGFIKRADASSDKYYDVIVYEKPLKKADIEHYSLTPLYAYIYTDNLGQDFIHTYDTLEDCLKDVTDTLQYAYDEYCAIDASWDVTWINRYLDCGNTSEVYVPGTDKYTKCEIQMPVNPIYELVEKQHKIPIKLGDIIFRVVGVNCNDDEDVDRKTAYDDDEAYSYKERYEKAIAELAEDTKGMTLQQAQKYYKDNTEDDNANYYGNWIYVYTKVMNKSFIQFGVRMD